MGLLSGIGNIFHSIGSFFSGGEDDPNDPRKKQQPQFFQPTVNRAPTQNNSAPASAPTVFNQPQKQDPFLNLFQGNQPGQTGLTKAPQPSLFQPQTPAPTPAPQPAPEPNNPPPQPHASIWHDITHNPVTNVGGTLAKGLVKAPAQLLNQAGAEIVNAGLTGKTMFDQSRFGDKNSLPNDFALEKAGSEAYDQHHGGLFNAGTITSSEDAQNPNVVKVSKEFGGNLAQNALILAAPGVDSAAEAGISAASGAAEKELAAAAMANELGIPLSVARDVAEQSIGKLGTNLIKAGAGSATGALINTGFGAAQGVQDGEGFNEILHKAPVNAATGAVIGGTVPFLGSALRSVGGKIFNAFRGEEATLPDEIATGVKSSNPNQAADAAQVHAQNIPAEPSSTIVDQPQPRQVDVQPAEPTELQKAAADLNTPAYQRAPLKVAAANEADQLRTAQGEAVAPSSQIDTTPAYQHKAALADIVQSGEQELNDFVNEHPEATPQQIEAARQSIYQQVLDHVDNANAARYQAENPQLQPAAATPEAAVPTPSAPVAAVPAQPSVPLTSPEAPARPVSTDVQPAAVNPQPAAPLVPGAPEAAGTDTGIPKNDAFRSAFMNASKNDAFQQALQDDIPTKDYPGLKELHDTAAQVVQSKTPAQLINDYGTDEAFASNAASAQEHLQAVRALEQIDSPEAAKAAANALNAYNDFASRSGYGTRSTAIAYQDMPSTMKVAYIQRLVQKAGGDLSEADLQRLMSAAELQTKFGAIAEEALGKVTDLASTASDKSPEFNAQMKELLAAERQANSDLYDQNRLVADIVDKNMPKSALGDRLSQSARTMMLSSVGGRVFALTGTGVNAGVDLAHTAISNPIFGNIVNKVGGLLGKVDETNAAETSGPRLGTFIKGGIKGAKGLVQDVYGKAPIKSLESHLEKPYDSEYSHDSTRYGALGKLTTPFRNLVKVGVGSHMALTQGIEDVSLESAARAAAKAADVPKENLKGFVDYYTSHPPKEVADAARQDWLGVNNLHQNNVSDALGKLTDGLENLGGKDPNAPIHAALKQVRTAIMPFTKFMGGYVDKMFTDRNVFYNAYRIAAARSPQELADQLGHLTINTAGGLGIGYLLAKDGVITNKDANGNSYDGLYFHFPGSNRYVPIELAGQFAMPLIMGAEINNSKPGSGNGNYAENVLKDTLKATGVTSTFGGNTPSADLLSGDTGRGIPEIGGTILRQHIPGFFGDINSVINHTNANPTGEAALTKVTEKNPKTGRQVTNQTQTQIAKTEAAIPGLSQNLPRKAGEAAPDIIDRMLHSTNETPTQIKTRQDAKASADLSKSLKDQGIPDPTPGAYNGTNDTYKGALEATVERGEYDKAIASIQQDIKQQESDKNTPPSTLDGLKAKVKQYNVAKAGNLSFADMKLYNSTSVSEWRSMGDSTSDNYDPTTYQKLWNIDKALADQGVAGAFGIGDTSAKTDDKQKYSAKKPGTGRGGRSGSGAKNDGNSIGSAPELKNISFGDLNPVKLDNFKIPAIQQIPAGQLIKARTISVRKGA